MWSRDHNALLSLPYNDLRPYDTGQLIYIDDSHICSLKLMREGLGAGVDGFNGWPGGMGGRRDGVEG